MPSKLPPVLVLGDHFGYSGGVAHGATTYFLNVLPGLVQNGVALTACFLREPHPAATALREQGINPVFLSASKWNPFVVRQVAEIARANGCRVLHAAGIKATLVAKVVARMIDARAIVHIHDLDHPAPAVQVLHKLFARSTDLAVCVSRAASPVAVKGYHVHPDRVHVVHNGIRLERIRNIPPESRSRVRRALEIPPERRVVAMLARMFPVKGHLNMLRMMPGIIARCPDTTLLLAGDGPERPACETLVMQLQLQDHVRFLGHRNDIPELLAAADLFVMPSRSEGLPIAAIEAFAAGQPVVAFNVGGIPDVVTHDVNGYLVEPGDSNGFVNAVTELLENDERRRAFGEQARIASTRFTLDAHLTGLQRCYEESAKSLST